MGTDELRDAARRAIEAAFPVEPLPEAEQLRNDHCPECHELAERFSVGPWPQITEADLLGNPGLSLLNAPAFRYYLPALMLRSMEARTALDLVPSFLVGSLSPAGGKPSEHDREKLTGYTNSQVAAILAFLRHYEACEVEEASEVEELLTDKARRRVIARAIKYWSGLASSDTI